MNATHPSLTLKRREGVSGWVRGYHLGQSKAIITKSKSGQDEVNVATLNHNDKDQSTPTEFGFIDAFKDGYNWLTVNTNQGDGAQHAIVLLHLEQPIPKL